MEAAVGMATAETGFVNATITSIHSPCYTASFMGFTSDTRKRLGRKRAGRVGVCVLER